MIVLGTTRTGLFEEPSLVGFAKRNVQAKFTDMVFGFWFMSSRMALRFASIVRRLVHAQYSFIHSLQPTKKEQQRR